MKGYYDYRFELFADDARTLGKLRQDMRTQAERCRGRPAAGDGLLSEESRRLLRQGGIDGVLFTGVDIDPDARLASVRCLLEPEFWAAVYYDGRTAAFAWLDPEAPAKSAALAGAAIDTQAEAFGPAPEPALPDGAAPFHAVERHWTDPFVKPPAGMPQDAREAQFLLTYYEIATKRIHSLYPIVGRNHAGSLWQILAWAGAAQDAAAGAACLAGPAAVQRAGTAEMTTQPLDAGPAGLPLLAVQAARRAVSANPQSAAAYSALADAYVNLWKGQEDYWASRPGASNSPTLRQEVRRLQWVAALKQLARLQPDNLEAQRALADNYYGQHYLDASLEHLSQARKALEVFQPRPEQLKGYREARAPGRRAGEGAGRGSQETPRPFRPARGRPRHDRAFRTGPARALPDDEREGREKGRCAGAGTGVRRPELAARGQRQPTESRGDRLQRRLAARLLLSLGQIQEASEGLAEEKMEMVLGRATTASALNWGPCWATASWPRMPAAGSRTAGYAAWWRPSLSRA